MATRTRCTLLKIAGALLIGCVGFVAYKAAELYYLFGNDFCKTTVHRELPSPDGKLTLVVFDKDCGATTSSNSQLSLMPSEENFSDDEYPPFFVKDGIDEPLVYWLDNRHLRIALPRNADVSKQKTLIDGVAVKYDFTMPESSPRQE